MAAAGREKEAKNKALVLTAYQAVFGDLEPGSVEKYFHPKYIEHNPMTGDGHAGIRESIAMYTGGQKSVLDIKRSAADGDLVWVHMKFPDPGNPGKFVAIMDIFRVEDGKIIEHWDVIQPIGDPKDAKNSHPFF